MYTKQYYVYIMTNKNNVTLYVGMTGTTLPQRIWKHRQKLVAGFTKRYNIHKLVYYEVCEEPLGAIAREKQLKAESRQRKLDLVAKLNPNWNDLYNSIV